MKKIFKSLTLLLFSFHLLTAQAPLRFNYQVALRDTAKGTAIANKPVNIKFSILKSSINGSTIYSEEHKVSTNAYGIVSLLIGSGSVLLGSLSSINWVDTSSYYIDVDIDGNPVSTTQLISVPYALAANQLAQNGAANGQVLKWNSSIKKWEPSTDLIGGTADNWGNQVVQSQAPLSGNGTTASPLSLSKNGASNGQVLKWNDTSNKWEPANDIGGGIGDNWGSQVIQSLTPLSGSGTTSSPLTLSQTGASNGQVLKWNDTSKKWGPANDSTGGVSGYWGTQVVKTNPTLSGNGTSSSPLKIDQQGALKDQVLKWDGISSWKPGPDVSVNNGFNHYIGELYGGGIIFFLYKDSLGVEHGIIASKNSLSSIQWSNVQGFTIPNSTTSWNGRANTTNIINQPMHNSSAAKQATGYSSIPSYLDWYLPSLDELSLLSSVRYLINKILEEDSDPMTKGLGVNAYWSSTEYTKDNAWTFDFGKNSGSAETKSSQYQIRPIRQF